MTYLGLSVICDEIDLDFVKLCPGKKNFFENKPNNKIENKFKTRLFLIQTYVMPLKMTKVNYQPLVTTGLMGTKVPLLIVDISNLSNLDTLMPYDRLTILL